MTADHYLTQLLHQASAYTLTDEDHQVIDKHGLEAFLYSKLVSKKYRKKKLDPECETRTKEAVSRRMRDNLPLKLVFPQGGYKLWSLPSAPTADWAEFFNIAYVLSYIAPLAAAYKPGVVLEYYLHTLLMEAHDNLTTEEITKYVQSFQSLISTFSTFLPENIRIQILKDADIYPREEYFKILEAGVPQAAELFHSFPPEKQDTYLKMAQLNIKWDGKENWSNLSDSEKAQQCHRSALYEIAASHSLPKVMERVKSADTILIFTMNTKEFIGIGSCKASMAKHWVGFGVLATRDNTFTPVILSPSQYQQLPQISHQVLPSQVVKQPNFEHIVVLDTLPNFR